MSWRRWPHPQIDFGRELYAPWRLAAGAVLYRDVDSFYGPLSAYINAAVFRLFGPGLITLVIFNLLITFIIGALLYRLLRQAWGVWPAMTGLFVFVSVFAFSQLDRFGNTNYLTPYAHETTHGILVSLALVAACTRWLETRSLLSSSVAGFLLGLTGVLKPEILLAGLAVTATTFLLLERRAALSWRTMAAFAATAALPSLGFLAYFSTQMPFTAAATAAGRAWLNVMDGGRHIGEPIQYGFSGLDHPAEHLLLHGRAAGFAVALVGGTALAIFGVERLPSRLGRLVGYALVVAGVGLVGWFEINWYAIGQCLLGVLLLYGLVRALPVTRRWIPADAPATRPTRLLLSVLAIALMSRMVLNGRVHHYGYYQAMVAGTILAAILQGEAPDWMRVSAGGRQAFRLACVLLIGTAAFVLGKFSSQIYRAKTIAVGDGPDRFYALNARIDPMGVLVAEVTEVLQHEPAGTLVVLPEGIMVNYLTRRVSPVPPFAFFSAVLAGGRENDVVAALRRQPPAYVVLLSRDLTEYGIATYGDAPGHGRKILEWVLANYQPFWQAGGQLFAPNQPGAIILRRRAAVAAE